MSRTFLTCSSILFFLANSLYGQYGGGGGAMTFPTMPQAPATPAPAQAPKNAPSYVIPVPSKTRAPSKHPAAAVAAPAPESSQGLLPSIDAGPVRNEAQAILEVIENQLNAVQSKDYKKAYYDYSSEALRNRTPMETFVYYVNHYAVLGHNKNAMFGNPEFKGNTAILRGTLTSTDGSSYKAEYHLIREGNDWKVNGLQLIPVTPPIEHPKTTQAGANYDFQQDIR